MSSRSTQRHLLLAVLALTFLTSNCGSKGRNSQVEIEYSPEIPIVINADFTLPDDSVCSAPWYLVRVDVFNNTDPDDGMNAVVAALKFKHSGSLNGNPVEGTSDVTAEEGDTDYPYLLVVEPRARDSSDSPTGDAETANIFVCGIPRTDDLSVAAEVEALGFFMDDSTGEIKERLSKISGYTAQ